MSRLLTTLTKSTNCLLTAFGIVFVAAALFSVPAIADCEAECEPEEECHGGCQIDPGQNCGALCENGNCNGRTYKCYETGIMCPPPIAYVSGGCFDGTGGGGGPLCPPEQSPCPGQFAGTEGSRWAIVDFNVADGKLKTHEVRAESASDVGRTAFTRVRERAGNRRGRHTMFEGPHRLIWAEPSGRCVKVEGKLSSRQARFASVSAKSLFFFDVRIGADGSYASLEPLYSDMSERTREAAQFLRDNLRLRSVDGKAESIQVFVGLNVTQTGEVGYFIAGAGELL